MGWMWGWGGRWAWWVLAHWRQWNTHPCCPLVFWFLGFVYLFIFTFNPLSEQNLFLVVRLRLQFYSPHPIVNHALKIFLIISRFLIDVWGFSAQSGTRPVSQPHTSNDLPFPFPFPFITQVWWLYVLTPLFFVGKFPLNHSLKSSQ